MPNAIKYSTSAQTLALKKGNYWIGTGDVGKGPTSTTDYYNGVSPSGGYTIYLNKASGGPSIYRPANDSQLVSLTNTIAGTNYSTAADCLNWFATQTDKMVLNEDYPAIVTNGLVLNLDAGFTPSYPTTGTTWYDVSSGGNNGVLTNGPTFSSTGGDSIVFDGVDDSVYKSLFSQMSSATTMTISCWCTFADNGSPGRYLWAIGRDVGGLEGGMALIGYGFAVAGGANKLLFELGSGKGRVIYTGTLQQNIWYNFTCTADGTNTKIYVNGALDNTASQTTGQITSSAGLSVGSYLSGATPPSPSLFFHNGKVASFQVYNRALTAAEVLKNYNAQNYLGSAFNPASSAAAILAANPSAPDGYYWINTNLGARNLYCIMSQGGWMGMTSELCPQSSNVLTSASWEANTSGRLQSSNNSILNLSVVEVGCGVSSYYQLQNPSTSGLNYTQSMLLMQRVSTIGQCSAIANGSIRGYYTGPEYTGSYTSYGMCTWGDGNFANGTNDPQNMANLKRYWVMLGSGTNPSLYYSVQCGSGGTGQHYHMWFIK